MTIYVCCPPRIATGGVELLQQLVFELNRQCFGLAEILYIDEEPEIGWQVPVQYAKYGNPYTVNTFDGEDAVFILPEIWAVMAETNFRDYPSIIWWESVDNYFRVTPSEKWYSFAKDKTMCHMVQSMYAKGFLTENAGIQEERIIEVSDYLGEEFLTGKIELKASGRKPNVLYNPAKGMDFTEKLIEASPELHWVPISRMTSKEVAGLMSESRVYVDFGDHPGKDRMPREAAARGCCIVTGRNGSASYYEDVPISGKYKYERKESDIPVICACIESLVKEYDIHIGDFAGYRNVIRKERTKFEKAVSNLISFLSAKSFFKDTEKSVVNIAVYGAGGYSMEAKRMIEGRYNSYLRQLDSANCKFKVKCFVDENPRESVSGGVPVVSFEKFIALYREQKVAGVVIPTPVYLGQSSAVTSLIHGGVDIEDIYCMERKQFGRKEHTREETEELLLPYWECAYLPYLEYHVVDHCNLNCKACEHYAPLVKEKKFTDYEQFKKDIFRLKEFIKDIGIIRIMGGEPLLNKELKKFILLTREVYPDAVIFVVTNALLLEQMDDELFYLMKIADCRFSVSLYPPMKERVENIKTFLNNKGVSYRISPLMEEFTMKQNLSGTSEPEEIFFQCLQAHCHNLYEGKLAACFLPFVTPYFNHAFDRELPCDGTVSLQRSDMTLKEIKQTLLMPAERCRYCSPPKSVAWEQARMQPPCLEDWIIG